MTSSPDAADTERSVDLERVGPARLRLRNGRGGEITLSAGSDSDFTPVELLLGAIGGCSALDVDAISSRRAEPDRFEVHVRADKVRDAAGGNILVEIEATFTLAFPAGSDGDAARAVVPRALQQSHDRLCTVSRTVMVGTPVDVRLAE